MSDQPTEREVRLVDAARFALRYVSGHSHGPHDDLHVAKALGRALDVYDDIEPTHDQDRREWRARREGRTVIHHMDGIPSVIR